MNCGWSLAVIFSPNKPYKGTNVRAVIRQTARAVGTKFAGSTQKRICWNYNAQRAAGRPAGRGKAAAVGSASASSES
jgi:hypothetical protein